MSANRPRHQRWWDFSSSLENIQDSLRPSILVTHLLPEEELQLELHIAWYRNLLGRLIIDHPGRYILVAAVVVFVTAVIASTYNFHWSILLIPIFLFVSLYLLALHQWVIYLQYRILKTNARFIVSVPQPNQFPLLDTIEIKGLPQVVDPNWSKNFIWRVFQFFTGARDIYISLVPFSFVDGSAKLSNALIVPDVMPEDVFELKRLVFPIQK
jgi:hypothetical protein